MRAYDFEYDGLTLSSLGYVICKFDSSGIDTVGMPEITFNTVKVEHGIKHELTSTDYNDCLTFSLQICKNACIDRNEEISIEEYRDITRWLHRKSFHKFKLINNEMVGIYFMCSFNISRIEMCGRLVGFQLDAVTNSPFALHEPVKVVINNEIANEVKSIYNKSDCEGHIYPNVKITMKEDGDLNIYNAFEDRATIIRNCKKDEIITIDYPVISSSISSHAICNDFNWVFFRLASTFKNRLNEVTFSLPCTVEVVYTPIVKIGI